MGEVRTQVKYGVCEVYCFKCGSLLLRPIWTKNPVCFECKKKRVLLYAQTAKGPREPRAIKDPADLKKIAAAKAAKLAERQAISEELNRRRKRILELRSESKTLDEIVEVVAKEFYPISRNRVHQILQKLGVAGFNARGKPVLEKVCPGLNCGKSFKTRREGQAYCSISCARRRYTPEQMKEKRRTFVRLYYQRMKAENPELYKEKYRIRNQKAKEKRQKQLASLTPKK